MTSTYFCLLQFPPCSFTPFIFSATGALGREATVAIVKHVSTQLSAKWGHKYRSTMAWICHLSFSLLCSSIMCVRGGSSSMSHVFNHPPQGRSQGWGAVNGVNWHPPPPPLAMKVTCYHDVSIMNCYLIIEADSPIACIIYSLQVTKNIIYEKDGGI